MRALADDAEALRTTLHLDKIIILAHSVGACVAIEYALAYRENVTDLMLVSPVATGEFAMALLANLQTRAEHRAVSVLTSAFTGAITTDDEFRAGWNILLPLYFHRYDPAIG